MINSNDGDIPFLVEIAYKGGGARAVPNIYLGGVSGCGKSMVCQLMQTLYPEITVVSGSQAMMKAANVLSKQELNALPLGVKDEARRNAFAEYTSSVANILAEGHFWLMPEDIPCFQVFAQVEVSVSTLMALRSNDPTRGRSVEMLDILEEHGELRARVLSLEEIYGIEVVRIPNDSDPEALLRRVSELYLSLAKA